MRVTPADRAIALLAGRQHGVFNRDQAFAAGATARLMKARVGAKDWLVLDMSVYGLPQYPGTWFRQLKVAELGTRDAAIGCRSAAALQDLTGFRPGRPEIVVPLTVTSRSRIAIVHRYAGVLTTTVKGFRCTTIAQTLFDLAAERVPVWAIEPAMDDALVGKRLGLDELEERLAAYRTARRHGVAMLRALIAERTEDGWTPPESELERVCAKVLAKVGGGWARQHRLPFRGPAKGRVDFALPAARLIVEADGRRWHTRVADFDRDRWRDNEAVAAGWKVLRFTWAHLTAAPDEVVALLRRSIA